MSRKHLALLAAAVSSFALAATNANAATIDVGNLQGDFKATNSTVTMTPDGIHFGTYSNGGNLSGSVLTHRFDGQRLDSITDLSYTFTHRSVGVPANYTSAPYLRIFFDDDDNGTFDGTVLLDPGYCATTPVPESIDLTYQMVGDPKLRFYDDPCATVATSQQSWADIIAAHGDKKIAAIGVTQGWTMGSDVSALLRNITVNGDTYLFGSPLKGDKGDTGETGAQGPAGAKGETGAQGPAGAPGQTITIIQQVPASNVTATSGGSCRGNSLRKLTVPSRKGWKLASAKASLRGKALKVSKNKVTVDLRGREESNYNVTITAKYKKGGKTVTVKTQRNLSVVCS